ncbi:gp70 [Rhodococcus phage ReqiPine5]|uniref:Gp70 n=1 Tax=Rhodococcus phage ReqiPine5 TaxID=691963 RepID=D4P845_9CAUD|nr:gp70 [Rhodococcus phage ReqiPine5]ADD81175.1 gp70 [Rhodococcus phage ReqiPine5]
MQLTATARAAVKYIALGLVLFLAVGGLRAFIEESGFPVWLRFAIYVTGGLSVMSLFVVVGVKIADTYHEEINQ